MKTRCIVLLVGLISLFISTAALAHDSRYGGAYGGNGLSGGVSIWGDSYGHSGYAGSLNYGSGYAYPTAGFYGYAHGPQCNHGPRHGYTRGYSHGYTHGQGNRRGHKNHHRHRRHY